MMMGECEPLCCRTDALCLQKYNFCAKKWRVDGIMMGKERGKGEKGERVKR